ncbi:MAG TPA: hypothetical protein VM820_18175 [Vicinamibacterales bacterium]|jgi:hypothetical protein|nr:hypothetical protein [Vicinamibacterales bacterium]
MCSIFRIRAVASLAVIAASTLGLTSCASEFTRTGSSPSFIIVESLLGAPGNEPDQFGSPLFSDVQTIVEETISGQPVRLPTTFNDLGQVRMSLSLRNPNTPTGPSSVNAITINRYHVDFRRADGRNTPGVDVPYPFDGAVTFTIPTTGSATFAFEVVRLQAKRESPLANLAGGGGSRQISTLAEVTFYGRDQAGNEVSAAGTLAVNFGDFADPKQ